MRLNKTLLAEYKQKTYAELKTMAKEYGVYSLLALPNSNPKTAKNTLQNNTLTFPMHLAPASLSGYNVCPMATDGCRAACLHTAGNPAYMQGKNKARIARTKLFFEQRELFMALLIKEISKAEKTATKYGMACGVRLNATSDIKWELFADELMHAFPAIQFYDYTKIPTRNLEGIKNYHLTFSLAESNAKQAEKAFLNGLNVAAVFSTTRGHKLPEKFKLGGLSVKIIDGDTTDYRPADKAGVIVGLRAKGKALHDTSGFVQRV